MAVVEKPVTPAPQEKLAAQPLYARVRANLVDRLISGQWKPGQMLPSEFAIAGELGVSQGTVRKALDEMTVEGLVIRKQGRGTFVAEAEDQSILFRFYRLTPNGANNDTARSFPDSNYLNRELRGASSEECAVIGLQAGAKVWNIERVRSESGTPILWERLILPQAPFPDLNRHKTLPNNVYQLYSTQYGVIVARVLEDLRAVSASKEIAAHLNVPENTPLLEIDRRAIALDGSVVEWRVSHCRTDGMSYRNELR